MNFSSLMGSVKCVVLLPLQVECKLIHVPSGVNMARHLPQLYKHFQTIGSPVMIGKTIRMCRDNVICVDIIEM